MSKNTESPQVSLTKRLLSNVSGLEVALIFGSVAAGRFRPDSDLDVLVLKTPGLNRRELHTQVSEATLELGRSVNLLLYSPEQLKERLKDPKHPAHGFINQIYRSPKIWLAGNFELLEHLLF